MSDWCVAISQQDLIRIAIEIVLLLRERDQVTFYNILGSMVMIIHL